MTKDELIAAFELFAVGTEGIGKWITIATDQFVIDRLCELDANPLTKVQFDQLLVLGQEAPISDGFFQYYWLEAPTLHPYDVTGLPGFDVSFPIGTSITSVAHLRWGLYRLYVDSLLFFGEIRTGYRYLRQLSHQDLGELFSSRRIDTEAIKKRGPPLPLYAIPKDDRYLISEMACKSYGEQPERQGELKSALVDAFHAHTRAGGGPIRVKNLLDGSFVKSNYGDRQVEFTFSAVDVLEEEVGSIEELEKKYKKVADRFQSAREAALSNTRFYLSMVNDLDVYVATSMRNRQDFRQMANVCELIFSDSRLKDLNLRYFDPTMSAADGHEDKGLIECLMVKAAKVLIYSAGDKESWGKDAEAAMALSQGKPVIFLCDHEQRSRFYRDVHPLSRLIEFSTGIAVGAIVTDKTNDVIEILYRLFENRMTYQLEQPNKGNLKLKETLTNSVVRLQTSDQLLLQTFWNHYHNTGSLAGAAR